MGKVVELETPRTESRGGRAKRSRRRQSKTALVLGGGGFTGGVYEIGALRALDLLAVNRTINEFDVYVGTSAGAFVASMVANGITPEEMMRVINSDLPSPLSRHLARDAAAAQLRRLRAQVAHLPAARRGRRPRAAQPCCGRSRPSTSSTAWREGCPAASTAVAGSSLRRGGPLADPDRTNDFRLLDPELYLTATDLDTTERVVLGDGEWMDVPISTAVAASGALPMLYEPVGSTAASSSTAASARPRTSTWPSSTARSSSSSSTRVVPYVNDLRKRIPTIMGTRARRVSDMGFTAIGNQAFRLLSHERLHIAVQHWEERYPGVDIILIEPEFDDELMFGTSIMDYSARLEIAKHGFESVTLKLARDYERYKSIAERHGIEISARRVRHVLDQVEREHEPQSAWRRVLEQTTAVLLRSDRQREADEEEAG